MLTTTPSRPRSMTQPGIPSPVRIQSLEGFGQYLDFSLAPGKSLRDSLTGPLKTAGMEGATVRIEGLKLTALHYVRPAIAKDDQHAAFYSDPHELPDLVEITLAVATIGRKNDMPFVHCHALWQDKDGMERGGHLFADQVVVAEQTQVRAWGLRDVTMQADFDEETNFTLFRPVYLEAKNTDISTNMSSKNRPLRYAIARIRPNEDLVKSIEAVCQTHGFKSAIVRGSVGSLVGAQFEDGHIVNDTATEILVLGGEVTTESSGLRATLDIALIDPHGKVHRGRLARGVNPVLICFELVLEENSQALYDLQQDRSASANVNGIVNDIAPL